VFWIRRRSLFKKSDMKRAAQAVLDAGLEVSRIEVSPDGVITVVPGKADEPLRSDTNPWDGVLHENAQRPS